MNGDPNSKTVRHFRCRDYLWETFEQMGRELGCSPDYLVNEAMRLYARSREYGTENPSIAPQPEPVAPAPRAPSSRDLASRAPAPRAPAPRAAPEPAAPPEPAPLPPVPPPRVEPDPPRPRSSYMPPPPTLASSAGSRRGPATTTTLDRSRIPGAASPDATMSGEHTAPADLRAPTGRDPGGPVPAPPALRRPPTPPPMPAAPARPTPPPAAPGLAGAPRLTLVYAGEPIPVDRAEFVIGRGSKSSHFAIKDSNISRRHCAVVWADGAWWLRDLGSTNGVEYDGERIDQKRIEEGDVFHLCDYELRFTYR